jgi:hypothetical protein
MKTRLITLTLTAALFFAAGFATSQYFLRAEQKRVSENRELATIMSKKNHDDLEKDIAICKKIYAARDKINAALGLPPDDSDPLDLGIPENGREGP